MEKNKDKNKKAISIKDVAKKAGVSDATVSLAINGSKLVKLETRDRILELVKEMGYVPNAMARGLAKKKSNILGLIVPDIENVYYSSLVRYINQYTRDLGYGLSIAISNNDPREEEKIVDEMITNRMEGVILVPVNVPNKNPNYIDRFELFNLPFIFSSDFYIDAKASCVLTDLEGGMYDMTKYVISMGYKNIVYVTGQGGVVALDMRENGFIRAINESGISHGDNRILHLEKVDYHKACEATQKLISNRGDIDVIMCVNDMMAIGVVNTLKHYGVSVPKDIAVTGFDDVIFSTVSSVELTTVRQDIESVAKKSVDYLIDKIKNPHNKQEKILINTEIVKRNSL